MYLIFVTNCFIQNKTIGVFFFFLILGEADMSGNLFLIKKKKILSYFPYFSVHMQVKFIFHWFPVQSRCNLIQFNIFDSTEFNFVF